MIREQPQVVKIVEAEVRKPIDKMIMHIIVNGSKGDKVRIHLPMAIVKVGLELGMSTAEINGNNALKNINLEQVFQLVEQGVIGKLVEVESAEGDIVEIFVE